MIRRSRNPPLTYRDINSADHGGKHGPSRVRTRSPAWSLWLLGLPAAFCAVGVLVTVTVFLFDRGHNELADKPVVQLPAWKQQLETGEAARRQSRAAVQTLVWPVSAHKQAAEALAQLLLLPRKGGGAMASKSVALRLPRPEQRQRPRVWFMAGLPRFPRVFARDWLISALILQAPDSLQHAVTLCAELQGSRKDGRTGEEPGKIFHEYPGQVLRAADGQERSTLYAASDTTALFLIAVDALAKRSVASSFMKG